MAIHAAPDRAESRWERLGWLALYLVAFAVFALFGFFVAATWLL